MTNIAHKTFLILAIIVAGAAGSAKAAPVVSATVASGNAAYASDILTNDLINSGQPTLAGYSASQTTDNGYVGGMNDGSYDAGYISGQNAYWAFASTYTSVTLKYNLNLNPQTGGSLVGYNITGIQSIAAWNNNNDASQKFTLAFETTTSNGNFIPYDGGAPFQQITPDGSNAYSTRIGITDNSGALARNVIAVEYTFFQPDAVSNGTVFQELDVTGYAAPEPGTWALLLAGLGFFFVVQRSRRHLRA